MLGNITANKQEFLNYLNEGLEWLNLKINEETKELFFNFYEQILETNKKFNLTRITNAKDFVELHIIDSLSIVKLFCRDKPLGLSLNEIKNFNILDIGSGAGFPGIPLALVFSENNFILVEATRKKAVFISECVKNFGLKNCNVLAERTENLIQQSAYKNSFNLVTARAVAPFLKSLNFVLPFLSSKGFFVYYGVKYENYNLELKKLKCHIENILEFNLPFSNAKRCLVAVEEKIKK